MATKTLSDKLQALRDINKGLDDTNEVKEAVEAVLNFVERNERQFIKDLKMMSIKDVTKEGRENVHYVKGWDSACSFFFKQIDKLAGDKLIEEAGQ